MWTSNLTCNGNSLKHLHTFFALRLSCNVWYVIMNVPLYYKCDILHKVATFVKIAPEVYICEIVHPSNIRWHRYTSPGWKLSK